MRGPLEMKPNEEGALLSWPGCVWTQRTTRHWNLLRKGAGEVVLTSLRVCKIWKNCKLHLPAATGRNCLCGGEAVLGETDENKKLTGNKQTERSESLSLLPVVCSSFGVPYWRRLAQPVGKAEVWFSESQSQIHKAQYRRVDLKPSDNSLITGTLNSTACQGPATMSNPILYP